MSEELTTEEDLESNDIMVLVEEAVDKEEGLDLEEAMDREDLAEIEEVLDLEEVKAEALEEGN